MAETISERLEAEDRRADYLARKEASESLVDGLTGVVSEFQRKIPDLPGHSDVIEPNFRTRLRELGFGFDASFKEKTLPEMLNDVEEVVSVLRARFSGVVFVEERTEEV
jgi:hypothetical protein